MTGAKAFRWGGLLALVVGLALAAPALAQDQPQIDESGAKSATPPTTSVRLGVSEQGTRLVIDSDQPISAEASSPAEGQMAFAITGLAAGQPASGAGLGAVRVWSLDESANRAVLRIHLRRPSRVARMFQIPPSPEVAHYRYVIDLVDEVEQAPPAALPTVIAMRPTGPSGVVKRKETLFAERTRKVVVIDAGHGGHDPGAQAGETDEKDITLAAALRLRHRLLREGRYRVVMTRTEDVFVPLEERVRIARRAGADLFIALHADSAGGDATTHGASVYTLSDHGETRVHQVLDGHEWFTRVAARGDPSVGGILLDLTQRSTLNRSNVFAQMLLDHLSEKIDLLPKSHRDAGYFVLLAPDVPAVLLEMGFITSTEDRARLTDPAQRDQLVDAVAAAIDDYFDAQTRQAAS